tara:strand:- start:457 stop:1614 length:1158 start_codon:yes stop_codon:yes gene_type:complete
LEDNTIFYNTDKIKPFYAIKIFEKGKKIDPTGKNTIHLSLGEPASPLPKKLLDQVSKKLLKIKIGYTESIGLLELRNAIVKHYLNRYKIEINVGQVAITSGASASILLSLLSLFKKGDTLAIVSPGYPCYSNILKALNIKVHIIYTNIKNNFDIEVSQIQKLPKYIKGIILSSPSNPTGATINKKLLQEINNICLEKNIIIISDEIYQGINYEIKSKEESLLSFNSNGIVINSFSKYFLMTGWRLGWIISNEDHIKEVSKLAMNLYLSPSSISQYTAIQTFNYYHYFDDIVKSYIRKRDFLIQRLPEIGFKKFFVPNGAFYFYIDVSNFTKNSYKFCEKMVEDINVTVAPGVDFDEKNGNSYIRISFAGSEKDLKEALSRIGRWL